jgi:cardiolipin synthase
MRIALVVPIVVSIWSGQYVQALVLIFVAGVSDGVDGYLAKTFDWRTRLGGILDPVADKLLLVSVFLSLAMVELVPVWLAMVAIGRDVIILAGASIYTWTVGPVQPDPSRISKLNTAVQLLYLLFVLSHAAIGWPPELSLVVLGAAVLFTSVVSGLDYVIRWTRKAVAAKSG